MGYRSAIAVDTAPVTPALVTLEEARLIIGFDAADDDKYTALITQATASIEAYCFTTFKTATYIETWYDPPCMVDIRLRRLPVQSITEVKDADDTVVATSSYALVDPNIGRLRLIDTSLASYAMSVKYVAGYDDAPDDLKAATIAIVQATEQSYGSNADAESERIGDYQIAYAQGANRGAAMPQSARWVLDKYRVLSLW